MNWGFAEFVRLELLHARYKSKKCELIPPNIVDLPEFDPDFATRGWLQGADAAKKTTITRNSTTTSKFVDKRWGNLSTSKVRLLHPWNILARFVAFAVLRPLASSEVSDKQL